MWVPVLSGAGEARQKGGRVNNGGDSALSPHDQAGLPPEGTSSFMGLVFNYPELPRAHLPHLVIEFHTEKSNSVRPGALPPFQFRH